MRVCVHEHTNYLGKMLQCLLVGNITWVLRVGIASVHVGAAMPKTFLFLSSRLHFLALRKGCRFLIDPLAMFSLQWCPRLLETRRYRRLVQGTTPPRTPQSCTRFRSDTRRLMHHMCRLVHHADHPRDVTCVRAWECPSRCNTHETARV